MCCCFILLSVTRPILKGNKQIKQPDLASFLKEVIRLLLILKIEKAV